jgi:recombination protein RecA
VVKNKMAPPFRECEFDILYGFGVSRSGEVLDMATDANLVQKSGSWFSLDGERLGQGRDAARTFLEQQPKLLTQLESKVLELHGIRRRSRDGAEPGPEAGSKGAPQAASTNGSAKSAPANGAAKRPAARPS